MQLLLHWCCIFILFISLSTAGIISPNNYCIVIRAGGTSLARNDTKCDCEGLPLPSTLFDDYPNLETITIPNCNISGPIPANIKSLGSLWALVLSGNNFEGNVLDNLVRMDDTAGIQLRLNDNQFSGTIPSAFASKKFNIINLAQNRFFGVVPNFTNLPAATDAIFDLSDNIFSGSALNALSLRNFNGTFSIAGNQFTGPVPPAPPSYLKNPSQITCITFLYNQSLPGWCPLNTCRCVPSCNNGYWEIGESCDDACCKSCSSGELQPNGTLCRNSTGLCDVPEFCDGRNSTCPADTFYGNGRICRQAMLDCDVAERCNGTSHECPPDIFSPSSVVCRPNTTICEIPLNCTGKSPTCPQNNFYASASVLCNPSQDICDVDDYCSGNSSVCQNTYRGKDFLCREAEFDCDIDAYCQGSSALCPANTYKSDQVVCRNVSDLCDRAENCTGTSPSCPLDSVLPNGSPCRPSASICDVTEVCDGSSKQCPSDQYKDSTFECEIPRGPCESPGYCSGNSSLCRKRTLISGGACRPSEGDCDIAEECDGTDFQCPNDTFMSSAHKCRPAIGDCDISEFCYGNSSACPLDGFLSSSVVCRNASGVCAKDSLCTGGDRDCPREELRDNNTECRTAAGSCDVPEFCTGNSSLCPLDGLANTSVVCFESCGVEIFCNGTSPLCNNITNTSSINCDPYCGDGVCNGQTGEDCVNCHQDCVRPCDLCGDNTCSGSESCKQCPEDCQCPPAECIPSCVHGICNNGLCNCFESYSGPSCDTRTAPIDIKPNNRTPTVDLGFNSKFAINILSVQEQSPTEQVIEEFIMSNYTFHISMSNTSTYQFWNYSTKLSNQASFFIYFYAFTNDTTFTFAGETLPMAKDTLKVSFFVSGWPFQSVRNSLVVWLESSSDRLITSCDVGYRADTNDNLKWFSITVDGQTLYTHLLDYAMLDGAKRPVKFGTARNTQLSIRAPFFWYNLTLDPNFALLVHTTDTPISPECKKEKEKKFWERWEIFLAIPIAFGLVLLGALIFYHPKLKVLWKNKCGKQQVQIEMD